MIATQYGEQVYAGVLGKIIGVYLGRPVEGWTYNKIRETFNEVWFYKNEQIGVPLIVPDDDISGTFTFYRALEDNGSLMEISSKQIGDTWLNYIIKNKTIIWWGGLSRSTEHTAYLRLLNGIDAPESGSAKRNGRSMAEQIGAQIFIDTWALVNPGNPELAVKMAREAAKVSHDGIAVDAACYLAALESMSFTEKNLDTLLDKGIDYVEDKKLVRLIADIREICAENSDWRKTRDWIEKYHGYHQYPGNCPIITNHLAVLMALIYGQNDFQKSIALACSAGWDTDCNSGNVGCLNGIRLGLSGINAGADLRSVVADRMYVVTADGGSCITDAVLETKKILKVASEIVHEKDLGSNERFTFEYQGSLQGWRIHPDKSIEFAESWISNDADETGTTGLAIHFRNLAPGVKTMACVETFVDLKPKGKEGTSYFEVLASPTLYPTQKVVSTIVVPLEKCLNFRYFLEYYDAKDQITRLFSKSHSLKPGQNNVGWMIPGLDGHVIYRIGVELTSDVKIDGKIFLKNMDWSNAPDRFYIGKAMAMSEGLTPWTTQTTWLKSFMSSAEQFFPDYITTFSISHSKENGVVTTGTLDWKNYFLESILTFSQQNAAGLVVRSKGHRRYYAAILSKGKAQIIKRKDQNNIELASVPFRYEIDEKHNLKFEANETLLRFFIDGKLIVSAKDEEYECGGAGYLVDTGAILADGFLIRKV